MDKRKNVKARLALLGKTQRQLCDAICLSGIKCDPQALSKALLRPFTPKEYEVQAAAIRIVDRWEAEADGADRG